MKCPDNTKPVETKAELKDSDKHTNRNRRTFYSRMREWAGGSAEAGHCSCNVLVVDKLCVEHKPLGCELISQGWVGPWRGRRRGGGCQGQTRECACASDSIQRVPQCHSGWLSLHSVTSRPATVFAWAKPTLHSHYLTRPALPRRGTKDLINSHFIKMHSD